MNNHRELALVTGASSGIGFELAQLLAKNGFDLIAVAENDDIHDAAEQLESHGVEVHTIRADLRSDNGLRAVTMALDSRECPISVAVLNAGIGAGGSFLETELTELLDILDLNVRSTVVLAKAVLPIMAARGEGKMLITSSVAATAPGPQHAVYNASKSFVQSLAEALHDELNGTGVTVTALMPGATDTRFFARAHLQNTLMGRMRKDRPADVAHAGFDAMMHGKRKVVASSWTSKALAAADSVLPDAIKSKAHRFVATPH